MGLFGGSINATFTATDHVTPVIKGMRTEVAALGGRTGGPLGGLLGGIGGLSLGMAALGVSAVAVVGVLGNFAKQAIDDQTNVDHLTTALKANVPGWNGATDAIDAFIQKGQDLAFTDDDIRDSITLLVPHTHDLGKAMDLTREAMDLARLKGISLKDASTILGKVFDGNTGAAKRAGIAIDDNATSTSALEQIQKSAAGQAETYGDSQSGALDKISIQWSEMTESLGRGILDVLDGIGKIGTAFDNLHRSIDPNYKLMQDTDSELRQMAVSLGLNADEVVAWIAQQKRSKDSMVATTQAMHENELAAEIQAAATANQTVNIGALTDKYAKYGLTAADVIRINGEVAAGTYKTADAQDVNAEAVAAAKKELEAYKRAQIVAANAEKRHAAQLAALQSQIDSMHDKVVHVDFDYSTNRTAVLSGGRASGGPVSRGRSYLVGENGPEVLHMGGESGYVTPGRGSGGGQAHTTLVYLNGDLIAKQVDDYQGRRWNTAGSGSRN